MSEETRNFEDSDSLMSFLDNLRTENVGPPSPGGFYSQAGDCFFYYFEDAPHLAEWIDTTMTVYRALDDRRIVGVQINGVSRIAKPPENKR